MTFIIVFVAFAVGFYLGVLVMCLLTMGRKREITEANVFDKAA
jgi:ABC-type methionine transport system permease subunit